MPPIPKLILFLLTLISFHTKWNRQLTTRNPRDVVFNATMDIQGLKEVHTNPASCI
jgi:hypothetical protein